jgi:hypothetical protein
MFSLDVPSAWFLPFFLLENTMYSYVVTNLLRRRWWAKVIALVLIVVHASIVGMDTAAVVMMERTLDGGLLIYGMSNLAQGATQIDSNTKMIPIFMAVSFSIEWVVLLAPLVYKRYIAVETKYDCIIGEDDEKPAPSQNLSVSRMMPLFLVSLYLLVGWCTPVYSPLTNFIKAWVSFYSLSTSSAVYKGTLGNCDASFPASFKVSNKKKKANLVMILNESLGNHVFKTEEAQAQSPFYREKVQGNQSVFFDFTNSRTNGANTESAAPASLAGYFIAQPVTSSNTDLFYTAPTLACMANKLNYTTAVYSAQPTHNDNGWRQLNGIFDHFDIQVSPSTLDDGTEEFVNDLGMDDRLLTDKILKHIENLSSEQPFFLLIFWNNNHTPFEVDKDYSPEGTESEQRLKRAVHSASMTDHMTSQVYDALAKKGLAEDTVMGFLSDHGESAPDKCTRIGYPDSRYLSAPMWIRAPEYLLSSSERDMLHLNKDMLTSTLDMVPTLTHILGWATLQDFFNVKIPKTMIHGQSLLYPVSRNRIVPAWQGQPFVRPCQDNFGLYSNATHNVIIKATRSTIDVEEVDDHYHTRPKQRYAWEDLPLSDKAFWKAHLESYPHMLNTLKYCGFVMPDVV